MPDAAHPLLIRADASARIGTGHVMRCLALAQGWRRSGGRAVLATAGVNPALRARLEREGVAIRDLPVVAGTAADGAVTLRVAQEIGAGWVIADGYGFDAAWQRQVRTGGVRLAVLDDFGHAERYFADLILNQNISADPLWYDRREPDSRLALGPGYALLREEFFASGGRPRAIPVVASKVLVTLGGSDPDNFTGRVVAGLRHVPGIEARVVIGGGNPHRAGIESRVRETDRTGAWLRLVVDAFDMPGLMAWADIAVTAGGSTLWETAYMGLPTLALVLADNQVPAVRALDAAGVVRRVGSAGEVAAELAALLNDAGRRRQMSDAGRRLVDGRGVDRVIEQLEAA